MHFKTLCAGLLLGAGAHLAHAGIVLDTGVTPNPSAGGLALGTLDYVTYGSQVRVEWAFEFSLAGDTTISG